MFSGLPQRLIVDVAPAEVLERLKAYTEPEYTLLPGSDLVEGMKASHRRHLGRVFNLRYISRLTERTFEIEATGQQAGQMGMLKGTITPWEGKTVIDARFVPNRNVWLTYGVGLAIGAIVILPTIMAIVLGILQYNRLQYSRQVLESFLPKLFSDASKASDDVVTAKFVTTKPLQPNTTSGEADRSSALRETSPAKPSSASEPPQPPVPATRTYSDPSGKFQLTAELLDLDRRQGPAKVLLRDAQRRVHSIGLDQLCEADQRWVLHEMRQRMQPKIAANKKLAHKRLGTICAIFLGIFLLMFIAMGCVFLIPFLQLFQELQR